LCEDNIIRVEDLPPTLHQYAKGGSSDTLFQMRDPETGHAITAEPATIYPLQGNETMPTLAGAGAASTASIGSLKTFLREQELAYLNRALARTDGDKEKAAELLGISLATLYRKLSEEEEP